MTDIVLASSSPRRKELLHHIFDCFSISPNNAPEIKQGSRPSNVVMFNALNKALASADKGLIISADTVVYLNGRYYLKPQSKAEAFDMLCSLSGQTHYVYTGVCLKLDEKIVKFYDKSAVKLKKLTHNDIYNYIEKCNPLDKAGAYGIQDNFVVETFTGSYSNIMGLPLEKLKLALNDFNISPKCR